MTLNILGPISSSGRKLLYFPPPVKAAPPLLKWVRLCAPTERHRLTEWLRGEPHRCGRSGGLSYKSWDPTVRLSQSPQTRAAIPRRHSFFLPLQFGKNPHQPHPKDILVYGSDWRSNKDVPDRRGAPYNGECLQGKTDSLVVCVPAAEGHLLHRCAVHDGGQAAANFVSPDPARVFTCVSGNSPVSSCCVTSDQLFDS